MSVPDIVQGRLDGEGVAAAVDLGGEDALYVTRTRTLVYRADGLISGESVEEYPHEAERIDISEGRRKSGIELDYGIEGTESFSVPTNRLYQALHPVLAGVLNAAGVTDPEETVTQTYQFSELTLVITSDRVVKHVGAAVWDEDYEEYPFADVTGLDVEEGSVSSQIIIESEGRPQRIKTPSDQTREVRERINRALLEYHDVDSYEAFVRERADPDDRSDTGEPSDEDAGTGDGSPTLETGGVDPIGANPPELDDDGAIIDDDAGVRTGERPGDRTETTGEAAGDPDGAAGTDAGSDGAGDAVESSPGTAPAESDRDAEAAPTGGFADSGFEPASSEPAAGDAEARLEALTEAVRRQNELLAEHQRTLERLVDELSRDR